MKVRRRQARGRLLAACLLAGLLALAPLPGRAAEYFVAPEGNDGNSGTMAKPFRTLARAVALLGPGDTCYLRAGTYRESVVLPRGGAQGQPIRISAWKDERAVLSGTEPLTSSWDRYRPGIMRTRVGTPVLQLFAGRRMMIEARWPNVTPETRWDRSSWARARRGSRYGRLVDPALAQSGIDWTGATAILNVAHQFYTWSRPVTSHGRGSDSFTYPQDLKEIADYAGRPREWEDDYYFLFGTLDALDAPGEWFQEGDSLYFMPPKDFSPESGPMEAKVRDLAIQGRGLRNVEIRGLTFFATTLRLEKCEGCVVEGCRFIYPVYGREMSPEKGRVAATLISGRGNVLRRNLLRFSGLGGFSVAGEENTVEDNIVHDIGWFGSLHHVGIDLSGGGADGPGSSTVRGNTVFNGGSTLVKFMGRNQLVEGNHVYDGCRLSRDVSLIYTSQPAVEGSVVRRNWAHGCSTEDGGIGIRGDDQTRGLTVDHNVVWNCGAAGIVTKGDRNRIVNNTVFDIGTAAREGVGILLPDGAEPRKPWRVQVPLLPRQNVGSVVRNNAATSLATDERGAPLRRHPGTSSNFVGRRLDLADPASLDFRPAGGSPLVDGGEVVVGITEAFTGTAPDIGAYERGVRPWTPGAAWKE